MATVIDRAVQWAVNIANDDSHGYDWGNRWGPDYDCATLVISAWEQAGVRVKTAGATYTGDMQRTFLKCGFKDVTLQVNCNTGAGLKKGDVLLNVLHHTEMVIEDGGRKVGAHINENGGVYGGKIGDQTGHEIDITEYSNYHNGGWDCVLRYAGSAEAMPQLTPQREIVINVPDGLGKYYTYMNWDTITNMDTRQGKLIKSAGKNYDSAGYGMVGNRYTLAMTSTFGEIGDYVDVYMSNGRIIHGILADEKSQQYTAWDNNPANKWGHNNGQCIVEWITNWKNHDNPTSDGSVLKVVNLGSYFEYPEYATGGSSSGNQLTKTTKQVTKSVIKSEVGKRGEVRVNTMDGKRVTGFDGEVELYIINKDGVIFYPCVEEGITLTQERYGTPAVLKFNVPKTATLSFLEGSQVVLRVRGVNMFYGYVFTKSRSKDNMIHCTAYDQLRYFKNKEVYVYQNKSAAELVKMIAEDFSLSVGTLTDTGYKIPQRVEDNVTLFDIVQTALSETLIKTGKMFFLYDDFGKLCIADASQKRLDIVIDNESAEDFDYQTSIDSDVCTRVKFYYDNDKTGERELYIANNTEKQNEWGVIQYCDKLEDGENGVEKANTYLEIYKDKKRKLTVKNVLGVPEAIAGYLAYVDLDLGDIVQRHFMLIERIEHKFNHCEYTMDLTLRGGDFVV